MKGTGNYNVNEIMRKPLKYLKGIGEVREKLFHRLGIFNIEDIISYFPREYEDRNNIKKINILEDDEKCGFEGQIASRVNESRPRRGVLISKLVIKDETGSITACWFNQPYIKNVFKHGERYRFFGRITRKFNTLEIQNPIYEKVGDEKSSKICRIVPVYPSTMDLSQNVIRSAVKSAMEVVGGKVEETLPLSLRASYKLPEINYALSNIHFPTSFEDFKNARYRLVFEELFFMQIGLFSLKSTLSKEQNGIEFSKNEEKLDEFIKSLPFSLTGAQQNVFDEIKRDMESKKVMNRLVQGDVGSGKTVVAALALYKAVLGGYQGALMVPTEILAGQHFITMSKLFKGFDVNIALLTGSKTAKEKKGILEELKCGRIDILIGTHALLEDRVEFSSLGLVVTDEQHRFGVRQRAVLSKKGKDPDVLVMTATPIPRTLALILYGDLDISVINELPPGRKPIKTYAVDNGMRQRIYDFIRKKVKEGRQVYMVCPLVEESEEISARAASELSETIAANDFKDLRVGLIHGKMKPKDKDAVMTDFVKGNLDILVSTTVIEVGVNVPNATVMVIENAERFGLSQLHQLRGRVGRGSEESFCILFNEGRGAFAKQRMKVMEKTNDGFIISEKDLELRGPGEFFGTRQHGLPELKIANLYKDMQILKTAQDAAANLIAQDPILIRDDSKLIRMAVKERFAGKIEGLSFL
ncbi:MAG TPA: ATP-dependent DNA helicase RecG [Pseudobacteroides sp.]|uniref:ATP-dependent DNA helicase RecG n=1 Tax=Pseudobacteroides sp. TaxID=1968840 RepID=UPI002F95B4A3